MNPATRESLWKQFGASIDMLESSIMLCPDEMWYSEIKLWYYTYHTLFYLDYYLTLEPEKFAPPAPYTLSEFDPAGAMPDRAYTKEEMLDYLDHSRNKCRTLIAGLTDQIANQRWINEYKNYSVFEILIYNIRHVQHHTAQINLHLRQGINNAPNWISQTKESL